MYGRIGLYCYKHSDCWDREVTLDPAENHLLRALAMTPRSVEVHVALALVLIRRGAEAAARELARAALKFDPKRAQWLLNGREARADLAPLGITDAERWARGGSAT